MATHWKIYDLYFQPAEETLMMIDFRPVEKWCDTTTLMYARQTLGFNLQYMATMNVYIPGWNEDIFK
jgi:hypothetical protein